LYQKRFIKIFFSKTWFVLDHVSCGDVESRKNKMDTDYFINCVRQVVCSYARMHAAIMEWPRFTVDLY